MLSLPEFPATSDVWDYIKSETRPILVYGMGNGADKLFDRLSEYGVTPSDVFASDGFVRGHTFRGIRVKSFSEIKETYSDFLILLSFASRQPDVMDMLDRIDGEYDMLLPDMPIAGVDEYFTKEFYNENYEEIVSAYNRLADDSSREIFASVINYKLTGRIKYLKVFTEKEDMYRLIGDGVRDFLDLGAYNGDTFKEALRYFPSLETATLVEPDKKTFKRLLRYLDEYRTYGVVKATPINAAVWYELSGAQFSSSGNRNSTLVATPSFEHSLDDTPLITVDSLSLSPDYIKYDVEGAEFEALRGSDSTIKNSHPTLLVSLYHRSRDVFSLINYLGDKYGGYEFYLTRMACLPAWEINLILKPNGENNET